MPGHVIRIVRTSPRRGAVEEPVITPKGYQLADPAHVAVKHHVQHATFVKTLDEAAALITHGFSIRMGAKDRVPSLISLSGLRIIRQE